MAKYNALIIGASGAGKTFCLKTLIDAGLEPFIISTEPGVENVLEKAGAKLGEDVHLHYVPAANPSWESMIDTAEKINTQPNDVLLKIKNVNKSDYPQFINLLKACANFTDIFTGKEYGPVDSWDESRALVLDGLTGTGTMSMNMVIGGKPLRTQPDWGIAMDQVERFIQKLVFNTKCTFVLIAHIEKVRDEISGQFNVSLSTLGNKLAPKIPPIFDEVICAYRQGREFFWSTDLEGYDLKARKLPLSSKLEPSFVQLFS